MLKKLCLSTALSFLSFASVIASTHRITAIKNSLTHIAQQAEMIEMQFEHVYYLGQKSLEHLQNCLGNNYEPLERKIVDLLDPLVESEECIFFLNKITDDQVSCIIDQGLSFDDLHYNPAIYNPIEQKIDAALHKAFPRLDELTEQLFNTWYIMGITLGATEFLVEKLHDKKNELLAELEALEATNEISYY